MDAVRRRDQHDPLDGGHRRDGGDRVGEDRLAGHKMI
jgi:hypothetical protein